MKNLNDIKIQFDNKHNTPIIEAKDQKQLKGGKGDPPPFGND